MSSRIASRLRRLVGYTPHLRSLFDKLEFVKWPAERVLQREVLRSTLVEGGTRLERAALSSTLSPTTRSTGKLTGKRWSAGNVAAWAADRLGGRDGEGEQRLKQRRSHLAEMSRGSTAHREWNTKNSRHQRRGNVEAPPTQRGGRGTGGGRAPPKQSTSSPSTPAAKALEALLSNRHGDASAVKSRMKPLPSMPTAATYTQSTIEAGGERASERASVCIDPMPPMLTPEDASSQPWVAELSYRLASGAARLFSSTDEEVRLRAVPEAAAPPASVLATSLCACSDPDCTRSKSARGSAAERDRSCEESLVA
jgi:hypothetical protein